ncbi:CPBP family intramembrane glutamic endopeptidase [Actinoplanes sp. NBRC 103695]|uniref:CPBP family intramembrane glutamic endopeptidase n=1 Tax=Actinoplanes sp. NBRC 103695 TaxID=3032202 RepID=UPI0024A0637F|nr:CPBP family intramembrane glutamic endopeptidase [Actinoplanes sp. NBRC 103695]GLY94934.1 CAAX amino protease [Actinoplanes sp. NBRC 103695]
MKTRIIEAPVRRNWIARHRLVSFFVLAYALAWCMVPFGQFQAVGALIAAVIVIAVADGRAGFKDLGRRLIKWRVPWYYYAFALLVPLVVRAVSSGLNSAPGPDWAHLSWSTFALWFLVRMVNPLDGPMAEEPSFRGYAVTRMPARLRSAALLGVLIAGWHLPLAAEIGVAGFGSTFVITFVYVWLFRRTGGSVLLTLILHSAQGFITFTDLGYSGAGLARQEWIEFAAWTIIALTLVVTDRDAFRRPVDAA